MIMAVKCALCGALIEGLTRPHAVAAWRGKRPLACPSCSPEPVYSDGIHLATPGPEHLVHVLAGKIGLEARHLCVDTAGVFPESGREGFFSFSLLFNLLFNLLFLFLAYQGASKGLTKGLRRSEVIVFAECLGKITYRVVIKYSL